MKGRRQVAGICLAAALIVSSPVSAFAAQGQPSSWAVEHIQEARDNHVVPSWIDGKYQAKITRAQFAEMMVLFYETLTGKPLPAPSNNPFSDTRSYYVVQAYELGIVKGTSRSTFSPNALISREQIAVMVYEALMKAGLSNQLQTSGIPAFADGKKIAAWSEDGVGVLAASGIIQGSQYKGKNWFMPKQTTTVEESVIMINRVYKKFGAYFVRNEADLLFAVERNQPFVIQDERMKRAFAKAQKVIEQLIQPGMSEYEKELAIHDYLVKHIAYDYMNYTNDTVPADSYDIYGALIRGVAVCQGYANSAKLLLNMAGIEAHVVTGIAKGELHAWNKVKINGQYYNLDVTWDDPVPDVPDRVDYGYFNVTDEQLRKDHSWQDDLPKAVAATHNYYLVNNLVAQSQEEFEATVAGAIEERRDFVTVKRMYPEGEGTGGLREFIFNYPYVDKYVYSLGSGGVITIRFEYRD